MAVTDQEGAPVDAGPRLRSSGRHAAPSLAIFGQVLGERYRIDEEIGRGAMGVVYEAFDLKLERKVALKTLLEKDFGDPVRSERFRREIESISGLRHPHIVSVHDLGVFEGGLWFVMDLIEGETLKQVLKREAIEPRRAFAILHAIAQAVGYAHCQGIAHRDIKPENILLDKDGSPYLTDFGLAFRLGQQTRLTATGQNVGTPAFMAPEQITGALAADERTDIYAIGATLYECLTGQQVFAESKTYAELVYTIVHEPPINPRLHAPSIARDAEILCMVCLEKEPADRYPSIEALCRDLDRFLRGEAVHAQLPTWPRRIRRWFRRHGVVGFGLPIAAGLLLAALAFGFFQRGEFSRAVRINEGLERERRNLLRIIQQNQIADGRRLRRNAITARRILGQSGDPLADLERILDIDPLAWEARLERSRLWIEQALRDRAAGRVEEAKARAAEAEAELDRINAQDEARAYLEALRGDIHALLLADKARAAELYRSALEGSGQAQEYARARLAWLSGDLDALAALLDDRKLLGPARALEVEAKLHRDGPAAARALLQAIPASASTWESWALRAERRRLYELIDRAADQAR